MPVCVVDTNLKREDLPVGFGFDLSELVCKITGKPKWALLVDINAGKLMYRDCNTNPCVHIFFHSFTQILFTKEATAKFVTDLTTFLHENLGVDTKRISFTFHPSEAHLVGLDGKTMAQ